MEKYSLPQGSAELLTLCIQFRASTPCDVTQQSHLRGEATEGETLECVPDLRGYTLLNLGIQSPITLYGHCRLEQLMLVSICFSKNANKRLPRALALHVFRLNQRLLQLIGLWDILSCGFACTSGSLI